MTDAQTKDALVRKAHHNTIGLVHADDFAGYYGISWARMKQLLKELTDDGLLYHDYGKTYRVTAKGRRYIEATDYRPSVWVRLFRWLEERW